MAWACPFTGSTIDMAEIKVWEQNKGKDLHSGVWKVIHYLYCWQEISRLSGFFSKSTHAYVFRFKSSLHPLEKSHAHLPIHKGQPQGSALSGILCILAVWIPLDKVIIALWQGHWSSLANSTAKFSLKLSTCLPRASLCLRYHCLSAPFYCHLKEGITSEKHKPVWPGKILTAWQRKAEEVSTCLYILKFLNKEFPKKTSWLPLTRWRKEYASLYLIRFSGVKSKPGI